jgi:hypothetical protein
MVKNRHALKAIAGLIFVAFSFGVLATGCSKAEETKSSSGAAPAVDRELLEQQKLFAAKCGFCHGLDRVTNSHHRGDEWDAVVKRMVNHDNGANLTPKDVPIIIDYLKKTYK